MDRLLWAIFGVMALTTAWTEQEIVWLFLFCGLVTLAFKAPPIWAKRLAPGRVLGEEYASNPRPTAVRFPQRGG